MPTGEVEGPAVDLDGMERYRTLKRSTLVLSSAALAVSVGVTPFTDFGAGLSDVSELAWGLLYAAALYYAWGAYQELRFVNIRNSRNGLETKSIEGVFERIRTAVDVLGREQDVQILKLEKAYQDLSKIQTSGQLTTSVVMELHGLQRTAEDQAIRDKNLLSPPELQEQMERTVLAELPARLDKAVQYQLTAATQVQTAAGVVTAAFAQLSALHDKIADLKGASLAMSERISGARRFHFWTWDVAAPAALLALTLLTGLPSAAVLAHRAWNSPEILVQWADRTGCGIITGDGVC